MTLGLWLIFIGWAFDSSLLVFIGLLIAFVSWTDHDCKKECD